MLSSSLVCPPKQLSTVIKRRTYKDLLFLFVQLQTIIKTMFKEVVGLLGHANQCKELINIAIFILKDQVRPKNNIINTNNYIKIMFTIIDYNILQPIQIMIINMNVGGK